MKNPPVILIILDGLGLNPGHSYNGWAHARTMMELLGLPQPKQVTGRNLLFKPGSSTQS